MIDEQRKRKLLARLTDVADRAQWAKEEVQKGEAEKAIALVDELVENASEAAGILEEVAG